MTGLGTLSDSTFCAEFKKIVAVGENHLFLRYITKKFLKTLWSPLCFFSKFFKKFKIYKFWRYVFGYFPVIFKFLRIFFVILSLLFLHCGGSLVPWASCLSPRHQRPHNGRAGSPRHQRIFFVNIEKNFKKNFKILEKMLKHNVKQII